MLNQLFMIGLIKQMPVDEGENHFFVLEVKRSYKNSVGVYEKDTFKCHLWIAISKKIISVCKIGDLIAIKGRLVDDNGGCHILCEQVILLNKTLAYS